MAVSSRWCERHGVAELGAIRTLHVAAYVEQLGRYSAPTVKQHLAAIRMLFDWLVVGQVVPHNPAHAGRGPRHSRQGQDPVLDARRGQGLLAGIDVDDWSACATGR